MPRRCTSSPAATSASVSRHDPAMGCLLAGLGVLALLLAAIVVAAILAS